MNEEKKKKDAAWREAATTQYNLRVMNATGIPEALKKAEAETGEPPPQYIKAALVQRLKSEGFLRGEVILNMNRERHKKKLEALEKYLEAEKKKLKK